MEQLGKYAYSKSDLLGSGSFGKVYKGESNDSSKTPVAIKLIEHRSGGDGMSAEYLLNVFVETSLLMRLKHPNIVELLDCYPQTDGVYLVMELCEGSDLNGILEGVNQLPEPMISYFAKQILDGLEYIHGQSVIHRDLKPQNILVTSAETGSKISKLEDIKLKIADFGISRPLNAGQMAGTACGTILYAAPEVLKEEEYDFKADIWSLGVMIFQCLQGDLPFSPADVIIILANAGSAMLFKAKIPKNASDQIKDLLCKMVKPDPTLRCSLSDVKTHPFFNNHQQQPPKKEPASRGASSKEEDAVLKSLRSVSSLCEAKDQKFVHDKKGETARKASSGSKCSSRITLLKGDITQLKVDAIVNASNSHLNGHAGVDQAIHAKAGPELKEACKAFVPLPVGKAVITKGYNLPAKHVIHTVGSNDGDVRELATCYKSCFEQMLRNGLKTIAFCCISTGNLGFPRREAAKIALSVANLLLGRIQSDKIERVIFCCFLQEDYDEYKSLTNLE